MKKTALIVVAVLTSFCASAFFPFAGKSFAGAAKDELVIGVSQFPSTFHPNIDAMLAKTYILSMTCRPFTAYDKDWKITNLLAAELPTIENGLAKPEKTPDGKDGVVLTVTIDPDAYWGDGVPVTTKDVLFTWEVGRHPKTGVANMEFYNSLYKIDVKDEKTFAMHFDRLSYEYNSIPWELIPAHIDETNFKDPENYKNLTAFDTDTTNPGLYSGPYRIAEVVSGSHVVLLPNPFWKGKKPYFKKITVRAIENTASLEANLLSGAIDMIAGELGLTVDQAISFERRNAGKFNFVYKPGLVYEHIDLNLDNPILKDKRVRKALAYALDRKTLCEQLFKGRQPVADTNVNPLDWVSAKDIPRYEYSPEAAEKLLNEAGWSVVENGFRHNAQGEKLSLELMTTADNRTRELVEQVLQSQWKKLGIDIRIRNEPARVFFGTTMTQRKFKAMGMFAWISSPESLPRTTLHSSHIPTEENNFAGQNFTGFSNPEMDDLIDKIEVELDREKRKALWKRLQEIYAEELPVIPLYFRANAYVLPNWLKGVEPTGHQDATTLWVENWRAE